jgi:hypothetical protein
MLAPGRSNLLLLAVLLAGMLFPFGLLAEHWPAFGGWADAVFPNEPAHWVGHAAIFAAVGLALLRMWPALLRHPARYAAIILLGGLGQELLQRSYKGLRVSGNDLLDLCVDLAAAAAVFVLARMRERRAGEGRP